MASVVYFKLKNAIQQNHVNFDGSVIQIGDVKRLVAQKQGLGPEGAAELTLYDSNTGDEYADDGKVIPRNTLVVVKRAPATKFKPLLAGETVSVPIAVSIAPLEAAPVQPTATVPGGDFGGDLYSEQPTAAVVGEDESKALQNLVHDQAATWQREVRQGTMRGRGRGRGRGGAPLEYRCPRCEAIGAHWLQDCPTQGDPAYDRKRVRPPVGIPMTRLARSDEGGLVLPDGNTGTLVANEDSFAREILGLGLLVDPAAAAGAAPAQQKQAPAPILALDNKPAEVLQQQQQPPPPFPASGPPSSQPPASLIAPVPAPKLAGEVEGGVGGAASMPGASFFDMYMRAALLPRGPPALLEKAYNCAEPLSKYEFERAQDEYRRRFNMEPLRRRSRSRSRSRSKRRRRSRSRSRSRRSRSRSKERSHRRRRSSERERHDGKDKRHRSSRDVEEKNVDKDKTKNREREKDSKSRSTKSRADGSSGGREKSSKEQDAQKERRKDVDKKEKEKSKGGDIAAEESGSKRDLKQSAAVPSENPPPEGNVELKDSEKHTVASSKPKTAAPADDKKKTAAERRPSRITEERRDKKNDEDKESSKERSKRRETDRKSDRRGRERSTSRDRKDARERQHSERSRDRGQGTRGEKKKDDKKDDRKSSGDRERSDKDSKGKERKRDRSADKGPSNSKKDRR